MFPVIENFLQLSLHPSLDRNTVPSALIIASTHSLPVDYQLIMNLWSSTVCWWILAPCMYSQWSNIVTWLLWQGTHQASFFIISVTSLYFQRRCAVFFSRIVAILVCFVLYHGFLIFELSWFERFHNLINEVLSEKISVFLLFLWL